MAAPTENNAPLDFGNVLAQQVRFWQKALHLQDWDISIQFWPHDALGSSVSQIKWSRNQKSAVLAVRVPDDLPPVERDWPEGEAGDYDLTIVHELLHLHCVDMESSHAWAEEQLCNHVAKALVNIYRTGQPQGPHPSPLVAGALSHEDGHPGHYL